MRAGLQIDFDSFKRLIKEAPDELKTTAIYNSSPWHVSHTMCCVYTCMEKLVTPNNPSVCFETTFYGRNGQLYKGIISFSTGSIGNTAIPLPHSMGIGICVNVYDLNDIDASATSITWRNVSELNQLFSESGLRKAFPDLAEPMDIVAVKRYLSPIASPGDKLSYGRLVQYKLEILQNEEKLLLQRNPNSVVNYIFPEEILYKAVSYIDICKTSFSSAYRSFLKDSVTRSELCQIATSGLHENTLKNIGKDLYAYSDACMHMHNAAAAQSNRLLNDQLIDVFSLENLEAFQKQNRKAVATMGKIIQKIKKDTAVYRHMLKHIELIDKKEKKSQLNKQKSKK